MKAPVKVQDYNWEAIPYSEDFVSTPILNHLSLVEWNFYDIFFSGDLSVGSCKKYDEVYNKLQTVIPLVHKNMLN